MDSLFLRDIQRQVAEWRSGGYAGVHRETRNILVHVKRVAFLHAPQVEALETYIFLKEVLGNKPSLEVFRQSFGNERELIRALGIPDREALDLAFDSKKDEKITAILHDKFGSSDYVNQVYALTMGSGKTILMAVMLLYDFVLSFHHRDDTRFAKNVLVFAPDTTIIESLKEIKTFDYSRVLPREYESIILNVKYHYLESTDTALTPVGNYNVIVSNSQKIILKTRSGSDRNGTARLLGEVGELERREVENRRLQAIRQLGSLQIFVDEAHHSYGKTLAGTLKKTRQTIEYLHGHTPLVSVVNLTGTPYVDNEMMPDVVYHFGLQQGIETGILKQVKISDYGVVRSQKFLEEVVNTFISEYGTRRLEGRLPKIAFYAPNIHDLRTDLRPKLESILAEHGISPSAVLEYHTEAEEGVDDFRQLDTPESNKQFVLLVGKGTEGWNCRSLVSVALYKKPKSTILVLQSTTRCLRAIGNHLGNPTIAHVFLSRETAKILDKELKSNFASSIGELNAQDQQRVEHTLEVQKRKTVRVKKVLTEILAVQQENADSIRVDLRQFKPERYQSFMSEGSILIGSEGKARYSEARAIREVADRGDLTFYELVERINRCTHLPCAVISNIIAASGKGRSQFVAMANESRAFVPFVVQEILKRAYRYEEQTEVVEEELELTKLFPFKISIQQGRNALVVYREAEADSGRNGRIGFHINPYAFDSQDEKDLFRYLRGVLDEEETIQDVYFTGASVCADPSRNDFHFEYWSPEQQRVARYFPDFLIETSRGRFIVVETKGADEQSDYEASKVSYNGKRENLTNEILAKEIGFGEFQRINKNFEYRLVFDASFQREQVRLLEEIKERY